jgi:hypothetical protein
MRVTISGGFLHRNGTPECTGGLIRLAKVAVGVGCLVAQFWHSYGTETA